MTFRNNIGPDAVAASTLAPSAVEIRLLVTVRAHGVRVRLHED
jgi:hypothetical protein